MYEKSCGAIIFHSAGDNTTVLLVQQRKGHWAFPKGHTEGSETELETATREIFEETGLHPVIDTGFRFVNTYHPKPTGSKDVVLFVATSDETSVRLQDAELLSHQWLPVDQVSTQLTYDRDKNAYAAAWDYYRKTAVCG